MKDAGTGERDDTAKEMKVQREAMVSIKPQTTRAMTARGKEQCEWIPQGYRTLGIRLSFRFEVRS